MQEELTPEEISALIRSGDIQKYLSKLTPNEQAIYQKMAGDQGTGTKMKVLATQAFLNPGVEDQVMRGLPVLGAAAVPAAEMIPSLAPMAGAAVGAAKTFGQNHPILTSGLGIGAVNLLRPYLGSNVANMLEMGLGLRALSPAAKRMAGPAAAEASTMATEEQAIADQLAKQGYKPDMIEEVLRRNRLAGQAAPQNGSGGPSLFQKPGGGVLYNNPKLPTADEAVGMATKELETQPYLKQRPYEDINLRDAYPRNITTSETDADLTDRILGTSRVGGSKYPLKFHGEEGPSLRSSIEKAKRAKRRAPGKSPED